MLQDNVCVELSPRMPSRLTKKQANSHDRPNKYDISATTAFSLKLASVSDVLLSSDPLNVNVALRISNNFKNYVLELH